MSLKEFLKLLLVSIGVVLAFMVVVAVGTVQMEALDAYEKHSSKTEANP